MVVSTKTYVVAVDQGTTSSRAILYDLHGQPVASAKRELKQCNPRPGWTQIDALELLDSVREALAEVLQASGVLAETVAALGITNQRETTIAWDRTTGRPLHDAIVWLDVRTADIVERLKGAGGLDRFRDMTGLPLSTYFSAVKMMWLMEHAPEVSQAVADGRCAFGTVDSWLVYNLTGGSNGGLFVTDVSNASRYMLMDLRKLEWSEAICRELGIPMSSLPMICSSSEVLGKVRDGPLAGVPIAAALGDQHAALLGQGCLEVGEAKVTYGTGCFILMNTGDSPVPSKSGLLTTVGFKLGPDRPAVYALEGSVAIAGRGTQWLRDNLKLIQATKDLDKLAKTVPDTGGVTFVPALSGLLAPHWRPDARGVIVGLSLHTTAAHVARSMREAVAFQASDVLRAMSADHTQPLKTLRADGGMASSEFAMQINSDIIGVPILRPQDIEVTALGAAFAAGLAVGVWRDVADIHSVHRRAGDPKYFKPAMSPSDREMAHGRWHDAVQRSFGLDGSAWRSKL